MATSVSQRFLLGLGLTSLVFTAVTSLAAFGVFQRELAHRQIDFLSQYVQERTDNVDRRFSNLITLERSAVAALAARAKTMTPAEADRILDHETVALPDGTRRSRDRSFDGYIDAEGGRVYGVGAFLGKAGQMTGDEKMILASAFPIVARFGQAARGDYDNFYFFAPPTRLVMFGPDRPDHLLFYRHTAPAGLDIAKEEMSRFISPTADPARDTRCTSLQRLLQDAAGAERVATACVTPAYVKGRYVGAFGTSIRLDGFLKGVVTDSLGGSETLVIRSDGALIAAPGAELNHRSEANVVQLETSLGLKALAARLNHDHRRFGVVPSPDRKDIIAYGRMTGTGWFLLIRYPAAAVMWSAARSASWVLLLGLFAAALQTFVLVQLGCKAIVRPLQALAATCTRRDPEASKALVQRMDEIGVLARSLQAERDRGDELLASLEHRVQRRTAELEKANAELEHANTEKSRFLANMSHELRTPLNGVIALSETLAGEQTTPRNVELAELIVSSGRLLEQVLTDILDFSKIEAGEMRMETRPFELSVVVSRVAELHRASADAKGIDLIWSVEPSAQGTYIGDSVRLTQVLSNLLSNAVKFTEAGQVTLAVTASDSGLGFSVRDTGIGFTEEVRARLFNRFEQADVSIRRRFGGTGLGLAICRSLVELMGGRIDANSAPGQGSTFSFILPLTRAGAEAQGVESATEEAFVSLDGVRVLLAEDHPTNRKVIQLILDAAGGVELVMVENGRLALDALERDSFHVVLMDMQMPELDGLSATAELRAREAAAGAQRTPVIMLTANALDEHVRASLAAGADRHLSKPIRAAELIEAITQLVVCRTSIGHDTEIEAAA
jgi:signal transduction histidine kinase/AmiR/NasT family two-component response regulator